jgi:hypothetical protein
MIEFETPKVWSVHTFMGGEIQGWPVQRSEVAGIGQAIEAIRQLLEDDYKIQPPVKLESTGVWYIQATPDCPDGYPKKYTVMAYVLPTTMEVSA